MLTSPDGDRYTTDSKRDTCSIRSDTASHHAQNIMHAVHDIGQTQDNGPNTRDWTHYKVNDPTQETGHITR